MKSSKHTNLVICSAMIKPARLLIFYKLRTWIDQVVRIVVHTFAVEESKLPLDPKNPDGYWYCAGDFCDIDEAGVYQNLSQADLELAQCLVSPNIKDDHPARAKLVISGEYGIHYVCHNITNRILYATESCYTLIDLDIKTTGYEVVVKSALGVYGQNKVEWERRKLKCGDNNDACNSSTANGDMNNKPDITRDDEIHKIHLRAAGGNVDKARNLTEALGTIDNNFYSTTDNLVSQFDSGTIDEINFHSKMLNSCAMLFSETISTVGHKMTQRIYPDCNTDIEIESDSYEIEEKVLIARA